jgi:hypothetical protein
MNRKKKDILYNMMEERFAKKRTTLSFLMGVIATAEALGVKIRTPQVCKIPRGDFYELVLELHDICNNKEDIDQYPDIFKILDIQVRETMVGAYGLGISRPFFEALKIFVTTLKNREK